MWNVRVLMTASKMVVVEQEKRVQLLILDIAVIYLQRYAWRSIYIRQKKLHLFSDDCNQGGCGSIYHKYYPCIRSNKCYVRGKNWYILQCFRRYAGFITEKLFQFFAKQQLVLANISLQQHNRILYIRKSCDDCIEKMEIISYRRKCINRSSIHTHKKEKYGCELKTKAAKIKIMCLHTEELYYSMWEILRLKFFKHVSQYQRERTYIKRRRYE